MIKGFWALVVLMLCSCGSSYTASKIAGVYTNASNCRHLQISYDYVLELNDDGTCKFSMYNDIYRIIGVGRWHSQGKSVIIEYSNPPQDIYTALMAGSYMRGGDTIKIRNPYKLRKGNVILRKNR